MAHREQGWDGAWAGYGEDGTEYERSVCTSGHDLPSLWHHATDRRHVNFCDYSISSGTVQQDVIIKINSKGHRKGNSRQLARTLFPKRSVDSSDVWRSRAGWSWYAQFSSQDSLDWLRNQWRAVEAAFGGRAHTMMIVVDGGKQLKIFWETSLRNWAHTTIAKRRAWRREARPWSRDQAFSICNHP